MSDLSVKVTIPIRVTLKSLQRREKKRKNISKKRDFTESDLTIEWPKELMTHAIELTKSRLVNYVHHFGVRFWIYCQLSFS